MLEVQYFRSFRALEALSRFFLEALGLVTRTRGDVIRRKTGLHGPFFLKAALKPRRLSVIAPASVRVLELHAMTDFRKWCRRKPTW